MTTTPTAKKKLLKLKNKYPKTRQIVKKKLEKILQNPHRYKHLSGTMHGQLRIHIDKSFVLTFEILEQERIVRVLDYDHHDNVYE